MAISEMLLSILVCPDSKQPVRMGESGLVQKLNEAIATGALKNVAGTPVQEKLTAVLVREDGAIAYPIRDDIPVMLVEEGIRITS